MTKTWAAEPASRLAPTASAASAMSNFAGGAFASLLTQSVVVPIDVVSQRLMVAGTPIKPSPIKPPQETKQHCPSRMRKGRTYLTQTSLVACLSSVIAWMQMWSLFHEFELNFLPGSGGAQSYGVQTEKGAAKAASAPKKRQNGVQLALQILHKEGLRGLYRGFGASIATFVPSSAIWCGLALLPYLLLKSPAAHTFVA